MELADAPRRRPSKTLLCLRARSRFMEIVDTENVPEEMREQRQSVRQLKNELRTAGIPIPQEPIMLTMLDGILLGGEA